MFSVIIGILLRSLKYQTTVSKAIISIFMVEREIIVCLADFHDTTPPTKVKT